MEKTTRPYKGMPMEGLIASWYTRTTGRDTARFTQTADAVAARAAPGAKVLEVAPGPGYLSVELARRGFQVTGVDISRSFVRIAAERAAAAGVKAEFLNGDAAHLPLPDATFDFVVCTAAFKNFSDPLGALNETFRVLRPGGEASIQDLRRDAPLEAIEQEVRGMHLSAVNALLTRWTFRLMLLRSAYTRKALEDLAAQSRFGGAAIEDLGIGFDVRLRRPAG